MVDGTTNRTRCSCGATVAVGRIGRPLDDALLEILSGRSSIPAVAGTLAASVEGVKYIERTAAERYEVQPDYRRFDQKFNMTRQPYWKPDAMAFAINRLHNRAKLVEAQKPGYGILDWGFANAAAASQQVMAFGINRPNQGPTSWKSVGPRRPEGTGKWAGDPATNSRIIKKMSRIFGAGDVGITMLDRRWVYSAWFDETTKQSYPIRFSDESGYEYVTEPTQLQDNTQVIPQSLKYVAVFIVPMHWQAIRAAPTLTHLAATHVAYSQIARLVLSVAEFIRGLGYNAIPSANCTALSIPLAVDAGLGELGRNAKLIHPVWGPVCRICKVITDLPMEPDVPIETGATFFCQSCLKCADACPARAIPVGPPSFEPPGGCGNAGVRQWQLNHWKCSARSAARWPPTAGYAWLLVPLAGARAGPRRQPGNQSLEFLYQIHLPQPPSTPLITVRNTWRPFGMEIDAELRR